MSTMTTKNMTRRELMGAFGLTLAAVPLGQLLACGGKAPETGWATGGTAAMTGASAYPNPFTSETATACKLTCEQILGPCHGMTAVRKDISEGHAGLPVRLALRVLDESCTPVPGATVDIWHAGPGGVYSGEDQHPFCNPNDPEARAARWFRGVQTTDADGRVDFDTCFPGWYSGRAIHIHFTVQIAGAESELRKLGFRQFRVRYHQEVARIELAAEEYERFLSAELRRQVDGAFKALGFKFVALDLEPFRSGRMNDAAGLSKPGPESHPLPVIS